MRNFIKCSLALISFAVILPDQVLAQQAPEEPDEIIVRAKPLKRYRAEVELAREEMFELFNEANEGEDNDVRCRYEAPTGSRIPQQVCFSAAQDRASARGAAAFLRALTMAVKTPAQGSVTGIGAGQNVTATESRVLVDFGKEWQRVMSTNQPFRDAVDKYRELEDEFDRTRGATIRIPAPVFTMKGPQCEASTYTEYVQVGNVARVTGKISTAACPRGTAGKFAIVARVRNQAGAVTPIEFNEMWHSADAEDYLFYADYPIGDDVILENLRVRSLKCTCEDSSQ
jgi:hypothetical protein